MKTLWISTAVLFAALLVFSGPAHAQSANALPIPGVDAAIDFPNEHEVPDTALVYKVAFDIGKASPPFTWWITAAPSSAGT